MTAVLVPHPRTSTSANCRTASVVVAFDRADSFWLRGYAHVLMAFTDFLLAYDWHESFDDSFHVFFPLAHSAFQDALVARGEGDQFQVGSIADLISFLHIRWPVGDADRMRSARLHLKQMIVLSRLTFDAVNAETDNDQRVDPQPQPDQRHPDPGDRRADHRLERRPRHLRCHPRRQEAGAALAHERRHQYAKVFDEPTPFDLVLWITGPATMPYLETGRRDDVGGVAEPDLAPSRGEFGSYAIWFN